MTTSEKPYLVRRGAPSLDGTDDLLYFLHDPQTKLRLRLPREAADLFRALERAPDAAAAALEQSARASYGTIFPRGVLDRWLRFFAQLDLQSPVRDANAQTVALQRALREDKKARVLERLPELVRQVPFYASYPAAVDAFEDLPVIGKQDLREHVHRLHVPEEAARYVWMSSSGTSGDRVQAPHVPETFHDGVLPLFAVADPSLDSDSRWVLFMPAECGGMACNMNPDTPMEERIIGNQLLAPQLGNPSVVRREVLERCARDIASWQPALMSGSPAFLYAFARYAASVGLKLPSLRAIFYHVEPASLLHTRVIESVFAVPARSIYIASELGWPAVEWSPGRVFASGTHLLEVLRDGKPARPGEIGNVVVTRMTHGSPILLRYDTRDLARVNEDGVSMSRILGRPATAVVRSVSGHEVASDDLDRAIAEAAGGAIAFYRLYRRGTVDAPRFVLECCPSGDGSFDEAVRGVGETLGAALRTQVVVKKTSGIPPHRGGRMPLFMDEAS